ncbi:MAG TPA: hypothetical protein PLS49_06320, partial [Candidatus Woesebacteria bacterium]|nr:hypothetical protein [Candidatus Woesebacteria bacterium]
MSEHKPDTRSVIIFLSGIFFIFAVILVLVGIGKYTGMAKDKAVELIKENAPKHKETELEVNSADSTYLQNLKDIDQSGASGGSLDVAPSPADYGFQMDMQKAAQQQDTIK